MKSSKIHPKPKSNAVRWSNLWRDLLRATPLALSGLLVALAVSWILLALANFSYGFWHDHGGVGEAIDRFASSNQYRYGFDQTTREQRIELFAGIVKAIHQGGKGLEDLSYTVPGHAPQTLLREPEIVHLQDVANLIDSAIYLVVVAAVIWIGLLVYFAKARKPVPSLKLQLIGTFILIALITVVVMLIGPVKVFYALHIWLFPPDHQWFFYYQESLMANMMRAPILFGWIALEWLLAASICFVLLQTAAAKLVARIQSS
ncbi:DUF1461 domain-containing protein [Saccharophagus sp. K07]|uniref:lipoprotein intramolecular transacylase Lit n=1 Tax=Saccharophagus sp. K07 TaxID=2283636 RepID=UPI0016526A3F|nr:DUF1461 domain-containing protein [Saccharophagus sp. K07]MBC6906721.1 DUF1461 domain-containing protein [Saccharophagus sp. K07]